MSLNSEELEVLRIYQDQELPRHTSYRSVPFWKAIDPAGSQAIANAFTGSTENPWGNEAEIYVHIPFCAQLCLYCGCNRETLRRNEKSKELIDRVIKALECEILGLKKVSGLRVTRIHFGGGTPNFLEPQEFSGLVGLLNETLGSEFPLSVEIDARHLTADFAQALRTLNCKWASLGVQELDPQIQRLIGRVQPFAEIAAATSLLRNQKIDSLNYDLIYGLPLQTKKTWQRTLEKSLELAPDRFSLFRFASMPHLFPWQKSLLKHGDDSVPGPLATAGFFLQAKDVLEDAGYVHVGLDHFAKRYDALALAEQQGEIARSFQGVVEKQRMQMIGLGPSAVSFYHGVYAQKQKSLKAWLQHAQTWPDLAGGFFQKYYALNARDTQQFKLIQKLYAQGSLTASEVSTQGPHFELAPGQPKRTTLVAQGILQDDLRGGLTLTSKLGKLLARVVAASFDDHWLRTQSSLRMQTQTLGRHSRAF